jgi:16S rRNA processing protein RimM
VVGKRCTAIEILVGKIGRAHGVNGDVVIDVRTDEPERRFATGTAFDTPHGSLTIASTRSHGVRLLARFTGVDDRTTAETLKGIELRLDVPDDERPDDPEEFYDHQLIGLKVREVRLREIGAVTDVLHLPAQDVLVLDVDGREVLVPFVSELVPEVDVESGHVVVSAVPGLLDAGAEEH